ncbi:hypothetical protein BC629DRAFT_445572 [Irpex lacteus]|nr:hypothetical protein BC629DRAFT_445572 [Irpex lacteus]
MSIWTDTSTAALQAQLENTLFIFHFFAGCVFIHVLGTLRSVEWLIGRGRVACRWSLFNAAGSRILPLVSIASSIAWLDYQELGQRNQTALFVLAQTTQIISQMFSLMIITLGVASIWNNRQITYLVETAFLGIAGISLASLASEASDSVAPLSHTLFALVLARMIFCGFLLVLAFWGILNSRRQNIKLAPQPMASRAMSLYNTMRRDMFQCYFVAFIAQLPAVVAFALHVDHSGLLRLLTEFVSFASL